jgi:Family of unknown function (DUF6445)
MKPGISDYFPLVVADNFYDNPDAVRNFALTLDFKQADLGDWPGKRTANLATIDQNFHYYCINRFLSLYFDLSIVESKNIKAESFFQLIDPFDKDKNNIKNKAWVHADFLPIAGVVYLTPGADPDSGTSLYKLNPGAEPDWKKTSERSKLHLTGNIDNEYKNALIKHSNCFTETVATKNIYNRAIGYDGAAFHCASNHHAGKPRLTQTFFIYNMEIKSFPPLERLNQMISVDNIIKKNL